jgi:DNA-binding GntR family transcriptional regulator
MESLAPSPRREPESAAPLLDLADHSETIRRLPLSEQAYLILKRAILDLAIPPGSVVTEAQLASSLGISKSPVRSALVHLHRDGLVTISPYKGTIVPELRIKDIRDLYEVRALLEPYVVKRLTAVLTREDIQEIDGILDREIRAATNDDRNAFAKLTSLFHSTLIHRQGNATIISSYHTISLQMERLRNMAKSTHPGRLQQAEEERDIFEHMKRGKEEEAAEMMEAHILRYLDYFVALVSEGKIPDVSASLADLGS